MRNNGLMLLSQRIVVSLFALVIVACERGGAIDDSELSDRKPEQLETETTPTDEDISGDTELGELYAVEKQLNSAAMIESEQYDFSAIDELLSNNIDTMGGGGGLILIKGRKVVYRKTFGVSPHAGEGAFTPTTIVPLASASKWISGGVITAVVENSDLEFATRAGELMPYYYEDIWDYNKGEMTVLQLFTHTHGMNNSPAIHRDRSLVSMAEGAQKIFDEVPMEYLPGDSLWYAGVGMQVAGNMAELTYGAEYDAEWGKIYQDLIAGPLGMSGSDYLGYPGGGYGMDTRHPDIGGSIRISLNDYAKYLWMLHNSGQFGGEQVLSAVGVDFMLTCHSCDLEGEQLERLPLVDMQVFDPEMVNWRTGVGSWVWPDPETGEVIEASSGGAWGCNPFIDRSRDIVGVFLPYTSEKGVVPGTETAPVRVNVNSILYYDELRPAIHEAIDNPI